MLVLHLALWVILCISLASEYTQADFDEALQTKNLSQIYKILLISPKDEIDPSVNDCEVLHLACDDGETDLVEMLLDDERIDPASKDNEALKRAAFLLHYDACNLLLRDPRVSADLIFETPWLHQAINPNFIRGIRNIPREVFNACAVGDVLALKDVDLGSLELEHLDLLLQRASQSLGIRKLLHQEQLRLLGAPFEIYSDISTLNFVLSLDTRDNLVIKRALLVRSNLLMTLKMLPVEVVDMIAMRTFNELLFFPLTSEPPRRFSSKPTIPSWPSITLLVFMTLDSHYGLSLSFPVLKWIGRALVILSIISLCLAILPFNRTQLEDAPPMKALAIWFSRAFLNFTLLIALPNYMLK